MKKLLLVLLALVLTFALTGCNTEEVYTKDEIDQMFLEIEPTQLDRLLVDMMQSALLEGNIIFMELGIEYSGTVEAYDYSGSYVYEALEPTDLIIIVTLQNDLEFCYYPEGIMGIYECEELEVGTETYNVSIETGFFMMGFESWDSISDSDFTIMIELE